MKAETNLRQWIHGRSLSARLLVPMFVGVICSVGGIDRGIRQWGIEFLVSVISFVIIKEVMDWDDARSKRANEN